MTENKRFQVIWKCLDDSTEFQDNLTKTIFTVQDVCKLLNELNNQADAVRTELQLCEEENTELQKENEQLKKDVDYWKQVASQYSNELNVFEHCKKYKTECKDIYWSSDVE